MQGELGHEEFENVHDALQFEPGNFSFTSETLIHTHSRLQKLMNASSSSDIDIIVNEETDVMGPQDVSDGGLLFLMNDPSFNPSVSYVPGEQ